MNLREYAPTLPITVDVPVGGDIWSAAELKSEYRIADADAFAAALALKYRCPLMTGDPELPLVRGLELGMAPGARDADHARSARAYRH